MTFKRSITVSLLLALMVSMAAIVSADDDAAETSAPVGINSPALQEATGLDAEALRQALRDGATPAELITANEGDVEATVAAMVVETQAAVEEQMTARQAAMSEQISAWLSGEGRRGKHRRPHISAATLLEATGLDEAGLRQALDDGSTLAELIEANGGDVAQLVAETVAAAMAQSDERRAEHDAALSERVAAWVDGETSRARGSMVFAGTSVNQALMEATGLDADGLRQALEDGESIEALIQANGGDVAETLSAIAEDALESMERSQAMFHEMRQRMDEVFEDAWRRFRRPRFPRFWMPRLMEA